MRTCPWKLICDGKTAAAIRALELAYLRDPDASHVMELGAAYLWTDDYRKAQRHFLTAISSDPEPADIYFGMAGVAFWCLGDHALAVRQWTDGLACKWTDWAGGLTLPLLLFFASAVDKSAYSPSEAAALVADRAADPLGCAWPGPLAQFVLGRITFNSLEDAFNRVSVGDRAVCHWQTQFYLGVLEYARGNAMRYHEFMSATAATSDDDFDSAHPDFLAKLWHAELFLARCEATSR